MQFLNQRVEKYSAGQFGAALPLKTTCKILEINHIFFRKQLLILLISVTDHPDKQLLILLVGRP